MFGCGSSLLDSYLFLGVAERRSRGSTHLRSRGVMKTRARSGPEGSGCVQTVAATPSWRSVPVAEYVGGPPVRTTDVRGPPLVAGGFGPGACDEGLLVVDDLDLWVDDPLAVMGSLRASVHGSSRAAVLTMPSCEMAAEDAAGWQAWTRRCDVIVTLVCEGAQYQLQVVSHRSGPIVDIDVDAAYSQARIREQTPC